MHPNMFNLSSGNGSLELWSKGNTAIDINNNIVYKTLYDPTPIGYSLPKSNAFTGFTTSNVNGSFSNGWYFYCNPNRTGDIIYFPLLLYYSNGILYAGEYWTAIPSSSSSGRNLGFNSSIIEQQSNSRALGFSLRPVSE